MDNWRGLNSPQPITVRTTASRKGAQSNEKSSPSHSRHSSCLSAGEKRYTTTHSTQTKGTCQYTNCFRAYEPNCSCYFQTTVCCSFHSRPRVYATGLHAERNHKWQILQSMFRTMSLRRDRSLDSYLNQLFFQWLPDGNFLSIIAPTFISWLSTVEKKFPSPPLFMNTESVFSTGYDSLLHGHYLL